MERIVCLLIASLLSGADEFIFHAQLSSENYILKYQAQSISLAMTKSEDKKREFACELEYSKFDLESLPKTPLGVIDDDMSKNLKLAFLNSHKEDLTECFMSAKISVRDLVKNDLMQAQTKTFIKILPLRFELEFGLNGAIIYYLE